MSDIETLRTHFPKLPELDPEEVKAVRSFLPGKLLGRTAALLWLVMPVLFIIRGMDLVLRQLLGADHPLLYYALIIGFFFLAFTAVVTQLFVEFRAKRKRRSLQALAVRTGVDQSGYFRIGPYFNTAEDRAKFSRADHAHEMVLDWIEHSDLGPLYLTGDSGSGKTSLMNAFVLPALREGGWDVIATRAWQDPEEALRTSMAKLPGACPSTEGNLGLADVIAAAAERVEKHLLLVLDQFEEFIILATPGQQQKLQALITELRSRQIKRFTLLLILRSEYQAFLEELGLPPLRQGENFFQVGRFTLSAGCNFMKQSQLDLQPDALDQLLTSAAEMDETPGLVRPITLNMIGYVLASGGAVAPSLDAGLLIHRYIEQTINQPAIRDFAPPILEKLITEQGTKRPRSEQDLGRETSCRHGEVRAVLTGLGVAALARPLDPAQGVWELSHDFVARAVARYLGRQRRGLWQLSGAYVAPALLAVMLLAVTSLFAWDRLTSERLESELTGLGITFMSRAEGQGAKFPSRFAEANLPKATRLLAKLKQLAYVDLSNAQVVNLEPLRGLTTLQSLILSQTQVVNLEPLEGLTALKLLYLNQTKVADLEPLKGLTALETLNLSGTEVVNLEPLEGLTALKLLSLNQTKVADLEPLKGLTALQSLFLTYTNVTDLEPLKGLTALQSLNLYDDKVADLEPLKGLTALQSLFLTYTNVTDLEPLRGLTALRELYLLGAPVTNLGPLKGLTALQTLGLSKTQVANLEPLKGLTTLQDLWLENTQVTDLAPVQELPKLKLHGLETLPEDEKNRFITYRKQHNLPY
jgi:Leucine-rich repeat (LRR) protein